MNADKRFGSGEKANGRLIKRGAEGHPSEI